MIKKNNYNLSNIIKIFFSDIKPIHSFLLIFFFSSGFVPAQQNVNKNVPTALPSNAEIRDILQDRVDVLHKNLGMVVGILSPEGKRIISYGKIDHNDERQPDGNTIFEIGSITKIFSALLLSDMAEHGEIKLDDPLSLYLPADVKIPERNNTQIKLIDLATHTSGLPFWPTDVPLNAEGAKIMFKYSTKQLYNFLSSYQLTRDIGEKWEYSNLGMGLVGIALCNKTQKDYATLVRERITNPLGMQSTSISLTKEMKERYGSGHDADLKPVEDWDLKVLPGAGSLHSTANDLLTFLGAFMGYTNTPLSQAMNAMLKVRRPGPNLQQALGWWIIPFSPGDSGIVTFAGQTLGYTSTIAYDPQTKIGVVVLSNGIGTDGALAWHILRPNFPVETSTALKRRTEKKEIEIDSSSFKKYLGKYQASSDLIINIEHNNKNLVIKSPYTPPEGLILYASDKNNFYIKEVDLKVKFIFTDSVDASGIIISFAGNDTPANRIK